MEITLKGELLKLLPEKAIHWPNQETIVVSDLHLGKAGHFRKHGIPISRKIHLTDLQILETLLRKHNPKRVILLGDLFHSFENNEWRDFLAFIETYDFIQFTLVEGNHDILSEYPKQLKTTKKLQLGPFGFTHIKEETEQYNISGHIHPGVQLRGKGRQIMTIPCYYFTEQFGILPAFGQFTGFKKIRPTINDQVYGIVEGSVIELT